LFSSKWNCLLYINIHFCLFKSEYWIQNIIHTKIKSERNIKMINCSILKCTEYSLQCKEYSLQCTDYRIQFTVYRIQFMVYRIQFTVYRIQFIVYRIQFTVYRIQFTVYRIQFKVYRIQLILIVYSMMFKYFYYIADI